MLFNDIGGSDEGNHNSVLLMTLDCDVYLSFPFVVFLGHGLYLIHPCIPNT